MIGFKGRADIDINGIKRGFTWNMSALALLGDLQNSSMVELSLEFKNPKFSTIANFLYAGAVKRAQEEKKLPDFTQDDAAEWITILGLEKCLELLFNAFEMPKLPEEKNPKAQQATGRKIQTTGELKTI